MELGSRMVETGTTGDTEILGDDDDDDDDERMCFNVAWVLGLQGHVTVGPRTPLPNL